MKKLTILIAMLMATSACWAYNETDLLKFKALNACEGCDLSGATLNGANFSKANLTNANLSEAKLYDANLTNANLSEAKLSGADFRTSYLRDVKGLDSAIFCRTKMPWGELNDGCP